MTKLPTQFTVGALSEYQDNVFDIFNQWKAENGDEKTPFLWFRGQYTNKPLLPSVLRETKSPNTGKVCEAGHPIMLLSRKK